MDKWIWCGDKTPQPMESVLGYFETFGVCLCTYCDRADAFVKDSNQADFYDAEPLSELDEQPTHWMPLPAAPEDL